MAVTGITGVIDDTFIQRFASLANSSSNSGSDIAQAIRGGGASSVDLSTGLRFGAQTYATAIQNLNYAISVVNISQDTLEKLGKVTDKLINITDRATERSTGIATRRGLNTQFQKLANEFQNIVENAQLSDKEFLTTEGLTEIFTLVGLDPDESNELGKIFEQFITPERDDTLASEETRGPRPVRVPSGAFASNESTSATEYSSIFSTERSIADRPDAYRVLTDLKALRQQIDNNVNVLDKASSFIEENITLVRATGLALLEIADQLTGAEEAEELARDLRGRIRKDARSALSQLENLDPIAIAALAIDLPGT